MTLKGQKNHYNVKFPKEYGHSISVKNSKIILKSKTVMPFAVEDIINVMMAVEKTGEGLGIEAIKTEDRSLIPSTIFSMHKIRDPEVIGFQHKRVPGSYR